MNDCRQMRCRAMPIACPCSACWRQVASRGGVLLAYGRFTFGFLPAFTMRPEAVARPARTLCRPRQNEWLFSCMMFAVGADVDNDVCEKCDFVFAGGVAAYAIDKQSTGGNGDPSLPEVGSRFAQH